jgi:hypothetical protein
MGDKSELTQKEKYIIFKQLCDECTDEFYKNCFEKYINGKFSTLEQISSALDKYY